MTTTDNLELELVSGTETFDTDKVMNNFTKIDTAVGNLQDGVGNVESLTTTAKTDLVAAINEVDGNIGDLSGLSTTAKENLVSAVNELNQNMTPTQFGIASYKTSIVTEITRSTTYCNKYVVNLDIQATATLTEGTNILFEIPYTPARLQNFYANINGSYARCFVNSSGQIAIDSSVDGSANILIIGSYLRGD